MTLWTEFLNAMIVSIGYQNIAFAIDGNIGWIVQLTKLIAFRTKLILKFAAWVDCLDAVIVKIRHQGIAMGVQVYPG